MRWEPAHGNRKESVLACDAAQRVCISNMPGRLVRKVGCFVERGEEVMTGKAKSARTRVMATRRWDCRRGTAAI